MTTEQAKRELDYAEQEITSKQSSLCSIADNLRIEATAAANGSRSRRIMFPLLALVILGIILMTSGHGFLGVLSIIGGIVIAVQVSKNSKANVDRINSAANSYKNTIDSNREI